MRWFHRSHKCSRRRYSSSSSDDDDDSSSFDENSNDASKNLKEKEKEVENLDVVGVKIIAQNAETLISYEKKIPEKFSIRFTDSFRFQSQSLEKLVTNLPRKALYHTKRFYGDNDY